MGANPKCRLEITHSKRGLRVLEMTWSEFGWKMFGGNSEKLKPIFESLKSTKRAEYTDESGTLYIKAMDDITNGR